MYEQRLMRLAGGATDRERFTRYIEKHRGKYICVYDSYTPKCDLPDSEGVNVAPSPIDGSRLVYYFLYTAPIPETGLPVMTQAEARAQGKASYWTGELCSRGHASPRSTATGVCRACNSENATHYARQSRYRKAHGIERVTVEVYKDDVVHVEAYAQALRLQRGLA